MEHIVQFGINIDDEAIRKVIINNAITQVVSSIKKDVMREITGNQNATKIDYSLKLKEVISDVMNDFLESNKEEIIDNTAKALSERLYKTKAVKTMLDSTISKLMD